MGTTLLEVIHDIGGGTPSGRDVLAVQMGGPSGGCVPSTALDTRVDYEEVSRTGAIMGSGGMVVLDDTSCMVEVARYFMNFVQNESCGKCTFCRVGTRRMLEILTRICDGQGTADDIPLLEELAYKTKTTSLCGLGQTAPNPVLTTLRYFRHTYQEHIHDRRCQAGQCRNLCSFEISADCTGCHLCLVNCPVNAIDGEKKAHHIIRQNTCIRCGVCRDVCRFNAVLVGPPKEGASG